MKLSADLSTRQLRAFVMLADLRHFTKAAQACHLSQPAFSAQIQSLESALGVRLFDRSTRRVMLTKEGELFDPLARSLLADLGHAMAQIENYAELRRGRAHIAALPSLAAGWLPGVLKDYHAAHPDIELVLSDVLSDQCIELVRRGQADFALASRGTRPADPAVLHAQPLCSDTFHLVCRKDHPLAQEQDLTLRDLAPWPFIHLARHSSVRQAVEAALHPLVVRTLLEVEQLATVAGMVEAGLGISLVPTYTLYQFERPGLAVRPISLPGMKRQIYIIRRQDEQLSIAAQALYDLVINRLGTPAAGPARRSSRQRM